MLVVSEAKKSTVETLQEFYAIIVALSLTSGFEKFISAISEKPSMAESWPLVAVFIAFISTVFPFYHGMNRHLYVSHIEMSVLGEGGRPFPLLVDVLVFIAEAGILFSMGRKIDSPDIFIYLWVALLAVDIVWSMLVWAFQRYMAPKWALNNLFWILIALLCWAHTPTVLSSYVANPSVIVVVFAEVLRSVIDYKINWRFYFPREPHKFVAREIIYLAGPYTRGGAETRKARFEALSTVAGHLVKERKIVYSPITMTHPIDLVIAQDNTQLGSEFWVQFDEQFMRHCSEIYVLKIPGWDESSGVKREIEFFRNMGVGPVYLEPNDYGITPDKPLFKAAFEA